MRLGLIVYLARRGIHDSEYTRSDKHKHQKNYEKSSCGAAFLLRLFTCRLFALPTAVAAALRLLIRIRSALFAARVGLLSPTLWLLRVSVLRTEVVNIDSARCYRDILSILRSFSVARYVNISHFNLPFSQSVLKSYGVR